MSSAPQQTATRRTCVTCQQSKPHSEFYSNGMGGLRSDCKPCHIQKARKQLSRQPRTARVVEIDQAEQQLRAIADGPWRRRETT